MVVGFVLALIAKRWSKHNKSIQKHFYFFLSVKKEENSYYNRDKIQDTIYLFCHLGHRHIIQHNIDKYIQQRVMKYIITLTFEAEKE